jgi:hypothetical protein
MTNWHDPAREVATECAFSAISEESGGLPFVTVAVIKFKHVVAGLYM